MQILLHWHTSAKHEHMAVTQDRRTDPSIYAVTVHDLRMSEIPI